MTTQTPSVTQMGLYYYINKQDAYYRWSETLVIMETGYIYIFE